MTEENVSIVWDKVGKFFQVWPYYYNGDGMAHAEKVALHIGGKCLHINADHIDAQDAKIAALVEALEGMVEMSRLSGTDDRIIHELSLRAIAAAKETTR